MVMSMRKTYKSLIVLLLVSVLLPPLPAPQAFAQVIVLDPGFDPNRILEDDDIFDVSGMSYERMVAFLRSKGTLADYRTPDIDGIPKTAAEIIWRVAHSYKINPKYLLVLLQKEQSLVESKNPTQRQFDWATGYGVCDSCSKDDPAIQNFKGFAAQLEWAAKQHREKYLMQILGKGQTIAGKAPGKSIDIDGQVVTPVNNATAMLYSYTPHIHGNLNLWRIWRRWFSVKFPEGMVARGQPSGKTYFIRLGQKRPFASKYVLESMVDPKKIVETSDTELAAYPDGPSIQFPKFALLKDSFNRIWLLVDEGRRHIADMATFRRFGFNEDEIIEVDDMDLTEYPELAPIDSKTEFPQGKVMQDTKTKQYWYVFEDTKYELPDKVFLVLYFRGRIIKQATTKALEKYTTGEPYMFHDAELVRGAKEPAVYVVQDKELRPIPNAETFESMGWRWNNVVTVPDKVLTVYAKGDPFVLENLPARVDNTDEPAPLTAAASALTLK